MGARRALWLCAIFSLWVVLYPQSASAAEVCFILNLHDAQAYPSEKSASVSLTTIASAGDAAPDTNAQEFTRAFLKVLNESLRDSNFFTSVTVVAADEASRGDYVLDANVLGVKGHNFAGRVWGGGASMRIGGSLLGPASTAGSPRPLIGQWECAASNSGGFLGGLVLPAAGSNERAASNNIKNIAKALTGTLSDKDLKKDLAKKAAAAAKGASENPLRGSTKTVNRKWRSKPDWDKGDYGDEIASFAASSATGERRRRVDGLWLTNAMYRAHQKLLPLLDPTRALSRPCTGCGDREEIHRGMLIDIEPLERFKGKDVYVIGLTFNSSLIDSPLIWHGNEVRRATSLGRADQPKSSVSPIEFLDDPRAPYALGLVRFPESCDPSDGLNCALASPVLAAFPTTLPDGSPLVRGIADILELRTVVDGRPVTLTFNLGHLEVKSLDDLKIR